MDSDMKCVLESLGAVRSIRGTVFWRKVQGLGEHDLVAGLGIAVPTATGCNKCQKPYS